eukprot:GILK01007103.1.p1 GENE.GILK01007103.1~~GILK01007103.1.p1  ORF type:complete len:935 (-),score=181.95 GILK01007103.1:126-2930(-)
MAERSFTLEEVERQIAALYNPSDPASQTAADSYLMAFMDAPQAWGIIPTLLQSPIPYVQFLGAQTLYMKTKKEWGRKLQNSDRDRLRNMVLQYLLVPNQFPSPVLVRLCLTLAAICVMSAATQWNTFMSDILNLANSNPDMKTPILYVLEALPDELKGSSLNYNDQSTTQQLMQRHAGLVLSLVQDAINEPNLQSVAIKSLLSWVNFKAPILDCPALINKVLGLITGSTAVVEEDATEVIEQALSWSQGAELNAAQMTSLQLILQDLSQARSKLSADPSNTEYCRAVARISAAVVQAFPLVALQMDPLSESLRNLLVECASHPDHSVAAVTFESFFTLKQHLQEDVQMTVRPEQRVLFLAPAANLVTVLLQQAAFPNGFERWAGLEEKEAFMNHRELCKDAFLSSFLLVAQYTGGTADAYFDIVFRVMFQPNSSWQVIESGLLAVRSVLDVLDSTQPSAHLNQVLKNLESLSRHPYVANAVCLLIGEAHEFLSHHHDLLVPCLSYLVDSLVIHEAMGAASEAFSQVCCTCKHLLIGQFDQLVDVCNKTIPTLHTGYAAAVIQGLCYVASVLPPAQVGNAFARSLALTINNLKQLQTLEVLTADFRSRIIRELICLHKALKAIFTGEYICIDGSESSHPVVSLLIHVWDPLNVLIQRFLDDVDIVLDINAIYVLAMQTARERLVSLFPGMMSAVVSAFQKLPHPSHLLTIAQAIDLFGSTRTYSADLANVFTIISETAINALRISADPDLLKAYTKVCTKAIELCPMILLSSPAVETVLGMQISGLSFAEDGVQEQLIVFWGRFVSSGDAAMQELVSRVLDTLLGTLLTQLPSQPRMVASKNADIFQPLLQRYPERAFQILQHCFATEGFPSIDFEPADKTRFINALFKRLHQRSFKNVLLDYHDICNKRAQPDILLAYEIAPPVPRGGVIDLTQ